jgi:hypothetical protein
MFLRLLQLVHHLFFRKLLVKGLDRFVRPKRPAIPFVNFRHHGLLVYFFPVFQFVTEQFMRQLQPVVIINKLLWRPLVLPAPAVATSNPHHLLSKWFVCYFYVSLREHFVCCVCLIGRQLADCLLFLIKRNTQIFRLYDCIVIMIRSILFLLFIISTFIFRSFMFISHQCCHNRDWKLIAIKISIEYLIENQIFLNWS